MVTISDNLTNLVGRNGPIDPCLLHVGVSYPNCPISILETKVVLQQYNLRYINFAILFSNTNEWGMH